MAYLIAAVIMTLSVLEDHSAVASLFKCSISYLWHCALPLHQQSFLYILVIQIKFTLKTHNCNICLFTKNCIVAPSEWPVLDFEDDDIGHIQDIALKFIITWTL